MRDGGKGDRRRKLVVPEEVFNNNWDSIFGKKTPKEQYEAKKAAVLYDPRQLVEDAPWQPGYEDAVIEKDTDAGKS
jgi:hypothetical protein